MDYKVVMVNIVIDADGVTWEHRAEDTVEAEKLDGYVADARSRWDDVTYTEITPGA